nr:hypothetical protein [Paenibacillus xylanexedens]
MPRDTPKAHTLMYRPANTAGLFDAVRLSLHFDPVSTWSVEKGGVPNCHMVAVTCGQYSFLRRKGAK